ncbi:MAG: sulfatase, partial [Planctomycetota bacterium]
MNRRDPHPHVLVLMCDQMQHSRIGALDGIAHTPTLDRLVGEGVRFSNAITCHGQCAPARAAFQTGRYPHECGVMANAGEQFGHQHATLGPQHRTIGHAFADAGYQTAYFGKSHLYVPLDRLGYADWFEQDGLEVSGAEAHRLGVGYVPDTLRRNYVSVEKAVGFLGNWEPADRPLFFTFSTNLPHPPFFHEEAYRDLFPPDEMPLPATFGEEAFADKPPYQREHVEDGGHGVGSEDDLREMIAQYYSMIAGMDDHFGRVVTEFERLGIWDDTLVLFFADHGDLMGSHGIW